MANVLILCHGNRWRSVTCLSAFQQEQRLRPPPLTRRLVFRTGGFAHPGKAPSHAIREYCSKYHTQDVTDHRSKIVTEADVRWADVIVYMDGGNRKRLDAIMKPRGIGGRVICLAHHTTPPSNRIKDPAFMATKGEEFFNTLEGITGATRALFDILTAAPPKKPTTGKLL